VIILPDVNVLVYAFRKDMDQHIEYREWLQREFASKRSIGISELVLSSVIRVTTHHKIFVRPSSLKEALKFVNFLRGDPHTVLINPGPRHWDIFLELCRKVNARGNLITDAYLAALAIESGCEWITADRDFARFPGLRWRHPLRTGVRGKG